MPDSLGPDEPPLIPHRLTSPSEIVQELLLYAGAGASAGVATGDPRAAAAGAAGAVVATAIDKVRPSPYRRRVDRFVVSLLRRVRTLEEWRGRAITEAEVLREEVLTVAAMAESQVRASDDAKLDYLANAVVNVIADEALPHDVIATLMSVATDLTATHLRILELLDDPDDWASRTGNSLEPVLESGKYRVDLQLAQALGLDPEDQEQVAGVMLVVADLEARGLTATIGLGEPIASPAPTDLSAQPLSRAGESVLRLVQLGRWGYSLRRSDS